MLASTATPLRVIACSRWAGLIGRQPAWTAIPITNMFAVVELPNISVVIVAASAQ